MITINKQPELKMKRATLEALRSSIAHWKRMKADRSGRRGYPMSKDCALCDRFRWKDKAKDCTCKGEPCPVFARTGKTLCTGTLYGTAYDAFYCGNAARWKAASQDMIDFLKKLLPKTKAKAHKPKGKSK